MLETGFRVIGTIVSSIVLGILANLLTPAILDWWGRTSIRRAERRISKLKDELIRMKSFLSSPSALIAFSALTILAFVSFISMGMFALLVRIMGNGFSHILYSIDPSLELTYVTAPWFSKAIIPPDAMFYYAFDFLGVLSVGSALYTMAAYARIAKSMFHFDLYELKINEQIEALREFVASSAR